MKVKEPKVPFEADLKKKPVLKPKAEKPAPVVETPADDSAAEPADADQA